MQRKVTTTRWWYLDDPDTEQEIDDEGYVVIPPLKEGAQPKGAKCGECGMKFENGKPYSYSCQRSNCPVQMRGIS